MSHTPAPADLDARKRALLGEFRRFLPAASVLHTEEALKPYECDGLTAYRQVPLVAVLPETVEQVQEAMRTCSRLGVPVVARGAGTGLSGGALPLAGGCCSASRSSTGSWRWTRSTAWRGCSPGCATSRSPSTSRRSGSTTRRTPPRRSRAASAATSRRTRAGSTA